jgi:seryl-tRNA synthetase
MSQPLRFKPVNPAHEMVYSADGGWVSWEDYQSLKDTLQCSFNSNRELKAEVKELKSQPDPLTAYLYAAELAKDDIKRLKAEVERLTKQVERLIVSLHKSHDEHAEALYKLKYKNERQTPRKKRSS